MLTGQWRFIKPIKGASNGQILEENFLMQWLAHVLVKMSAYEKSETLVLLQI